MNCILAMLHDVSHSRWHPIVFRNSPRPSEDDADSVTRYKSQGHHTTGFPSREEALQFVNEEMTEWAKKSFSNVNYCLEKDFPWDGNETPAMVIHFTKDETPVPVY